MLEWRKSKIRWPGFFRAFLVVPAMMAAGCASIVKDKWQNISITAPECEEAVQCTLRNKRGAFLIAVPGTVNVRKSDDPLHIECKGEEGKSYIGVAESKMGDMIWGNMVLGGVVGAFIDSSTDAHRIYPHLISVPMCTAGNEQDPPTLEYPGPPTEQPGSEPGNEKKKS